jgi:glycosyltransferase involved in cell wall biosynthesis
VPHLENPVFTSLSNVASSRSWLGDRIERWLERQILERSARVVTATERHARALRSAYPHLPPDRICTITNGYDAEDLEAVEAAAPAPTFTLSYLGTFYFHRTPKPLFEALRQLIRERRFSPGEVQVNLFGDVRTTTDGAVEELISTYGLADCVRVREPVPYGESLRQMMQSHVLLLFAPNQACSVPAKTFEYLAMRRRILCLADEGATADLINQTGAGLVVPPDDVPALKRALVELFDEFKTGRPAPGVSPSRFERGALARRLSDLLQEIG